jgi:hypothetical protein
MKNQSGKRKAESGICLSRANDCASGFFLFAIFSFRHGAAAGRFSFRFPLSAFRFCL